MGKQWRFKFGAACMALTLMVSAEFGGIGIGHAEAEGARLTEELDQVLPFQLYKYGKPIQNQAILRTDDAYVWKWMNRGNGLQGLMTDGKGTFYYYDDSNIVHAVNSENEELWMSEPFQSKIIRMNLSGNGNIIVQISGNNSTFRVIDSKMEPVTTKQLVLLNRFGQILLDQTVLEPPTLSTMPAFVGDQIVALTEAGVVSYDQEGRIQWKYTDRIKFEGSGQSIRTNLLSIRVYPSIQMAALLTTDGEYITIDLQNGKLRSVEKATEQTLRYKGTNRVVIQNDKGLYLDGEKWLTESELLAAFDSRAAVPASTVRSINMPGGSYSVVPQENALVVRDLEGQVRYTYTFPDTRFTVPRNLVWNESGDAYFSDSGGNLYGLDAEGNEQFRFIRNENNLMVSTLAPAPDGGVLGIMDGVGLFRISPAGIGIQVNGEDVAFTQSPYIHEGTTMVPFRPVFEKLGLDVGWDEWTQTVRGTKAGVDIRLQLGSTEATVDNQRTELSVAPMVRDGTTFVPLRFIGEALHLQVEWDGLERQVRIGKPDVLAQQLIVRFLKHLRQGDEHKATQDLLDSGRSIAVRAPVLAPYFISTQWRSDIQSISATLQPDGSYLVKTSQRDRSFGNNLIKDIFQNHWYQVKWSEPGGWKLDNSDLFQRGTLF